MPRIGAEPERRRALITAAIDMIGEQGSLEVSVKDIAKQAGMSSALAFHYFGGKDEIITETMRHLLRELTASMTAGLRSAETPMERVDAVIAASFAADQFDRKTIAAWLVFYLHAYSSPRAAQLLAIYTSRLNSNLVSGLRELTDPISAFRIAEGLGALIDGIYIRQGLKQKGPDASAAMRLCQDYVQGTLGNSGNAPGGGAGKRRTLN